MWNTPVARRLERACTAPLLGLFLASTPVLAQPAPPIPTLAVGIKVLKLSWNTLPLATFYRVYQDPTGSSGFTQLGGDFPQPPGAPTRATFNLPISVHKVKWGQVLFRVDACNAAGCSSSVNLTTSASREAIGYAKAATVSANALFGRSVALSTSGTTLAVGAYGDSTDQGVVRVIVRNGVTWSEQARLQAPVPVTGAWLGYSVSLSDDGNTLAAGAFNEDNGTGRVYVFSRTGSTWSTGVQLSASTPDWTDNFGASVALSGDGNTLAVGAPNEDSNATGINGNQADNSAGASGAAYVFVRSGTAWTQQAYVKASNTAALAGFGVALGLSSDGNTLAVGGPGISSQTGAAYVFTRSATTWTQQALLQTSTPTAGDGLGGSVSVSGDGNLIAVGAPTRNAGEGAVYLFSRSGTAWTQLSELRASVPAAGDSFGYSVALGRPGNGLVVGAPFEDGNGNGVTGVPGSTGSLSSGAAYLFTPGSTGTWAQTAYLKSPAPDSTDDFGISVAHASGGEVIAVGAHQEDGSTPGINNDTASNNAASNAGAVYLY